MPEGTIKRLMDKGFGFINTGKAKDLFFHSSNLQDVRFEELREGQRVSFTEGQGPKNRLPSSELWNVAGHLLQRGWLQNQARTKPRGYAGDYEMLARIYENRLCDDLLGRLFDEYFQAQAAPQAVRNRMAMIADWIVEAASANHGSLRVSIVGSALGLEIREALLRLDEAARARLHVSLLD